MLSIAACFPSKNKCCMKYNLHILCIIPGTDYPYPMVNHAEASHVNLEKMKKVYQEISQYIGPGKCLNIIMHENETVIHPRNLKGGIGSLFYPCVSAMGQQPYCPSRTRVSYCTFRFGAIIWHDLRTLSLPRDSPRYNLYACVI